MSLGTSDALLQLTPLARAEFTAETPWVVRWEARAAQAREWYERGCSCHQQGHLEDAVQALSYSLELSPGNIGVQFELARALSSVGNFSDAEVLFEAVIQQEPGNGYVYFYLAWATYHLHRVPEAVELWQCAARLLEDPSESLENLAMAYRRLGNSEKEKECWFRLNQFRPDHPAALHMLAAHGDLPLPPRATDTYLEYIFDRFSHDFDRVLNALEYRIPSLLEDVLHQIHGQPAGAFNVLDAGCGTGLCGCTLRPWARRLVGLDISSGMLAQADQRKLYDHLIKSEVNDYLRASNQSYDWIVAADVFCYSGEISAALRAAALALVSGGRFFLTLEKYPSEESHHYPGYKLQSHGRYCHTKDYFVTAVRDSGLQIETLITETIRYEGGKPVEGLCAVLRRS